MDCPTMHFQVPKQAHKLGKARKGLPKLNSTFAASYKPN